LPSPPIIDVHVHVFPPGVIRDREEHLDCDEWFCNLYSDPRSRMVSAEDVLTEMDASGVARSVIFGFAYRDQGLCREANDYVLEALRAHPDRFIGFACVSPDQPGAVAELERCLDAGFAGCGELFPDGQDFDLRDSPGLDRVARVLVERDRPLNVHANEPVGHVYAGKGDNTPGPCYAFAERHPDLDIIYAHMGGGLFFYELMGKVKQVLVRVYYDTSAVPYLYRNEVYTVAAATAGTDKLLFGSDYPLLSPARYLAEAADLERELHDAVFGGNAARLLRLD
jgi:predicted TIM-barrel fold metal-dependent hydrolase